MEVMDPGHIYWVPNLETPPAPAWRRRIAAEIARIMCRLLGGQCIVFLKRSSDMVHYPREWPGSNTQEVIRAVHDRTQFLYDLGPCDETGNALSWLEMSLYEYEVRAYRRKRDKLNKKAEAQAETDELEATRDMYRDIPFTPQQCIEMPCGSDGHVIVEVES